MSIRSLKIWLVIWCVLLMGAAHTGSNLPVTGDQAWDSLVRLKHHWMHELFDLVKTNRPDLKEVAKITLAWRIAEMDLESRKFKFLFQKHPEHLVRDQGLPAFVNLNWFSEYTSELQLQDPAFSSLQKRVQHLKELSARHPDRAKLDQYLKDLSKDKRYKDRFDRFYKELAQVQRTLSLTDVAQSRR